MRKTTQRGLRSRAVGVVGAALVVVLTIGAGFGSDTAVAGANLKAATTNATVAPGGPIANETTMWCARQQAAGSPAANAWPCTSSRARTRECPISRAGCPNHTCYASSCSGQDPGATGCGVSGSTNQEVYGGPGPPGENYYVANRWSNLCQANWTRTRVIGPQGGNMNANAGYDAKYIYCCGYYYSPGWDIQSYYGSGSTVWSNMLNGAPGTHCVGSFDININRYFWTDCF